LQVLNISNVPWAISKGLNSLGVYSRVLDFKSGTGVYKFPFDYSMRLEGQPLGVQAYRRFKWYAWALKNFDIIHMHSSSMLPFYADAPLTKIITADKVKLVYSHWGADVRSGTVPLLSRLNCAKRFVAPDLYKCVPEGTEILPVCIDLDYWKPEKSVSKRHSKKIRILHAPTNREFKGTKHVLSAVEKLEKRGYPIELDLVENISLSDLKKRIEQADIVVDQLSGWYATFACEAMACGKPVMASLRPDVLRFYQDCPIVDINKDNLAAKLSELIEDESLRKRKSAECLKYVRKTHDSLKIARRLKSVYEEIL